jgi:transcriptional regulator with XRE-family HTH domain
MHRPPDKPEPLSAAAVAKARTEFGHRLEQLRREHSWTQLEAGERAGLSQTEWSRVERALTNPSLTTLLRMQHALDLDSVEALLGDPPSRRIVR